LKLGDIVYGSGQVGYD